MSSRTVHYAHRVLDADESCWVGFGAAETRKNQRGLSRDQMTAVEFGRYLDCEIDILDGFGDRCGVGHSGQ